MFASLVPAAFRSGFASAATRRAAVGGQGSHELCVRSIFVPNPWGPGQALLIRRPELSTSRSFMCRLSSMSAHRKHRLNEIVAAVVEHTSLDVPVLAGRFGPFDRGRAQDLLDDLDTRVR